MKTKSIVFTLLFTSIMLSCGSSKTVINPDDKIIGEWNLITKSTPQGDVPSIMTITKNDGGQFEGSFKSIMGEYAMSNLILKNGELSCNFNVQGLLFEFKGVFINDEFKGETLAPNESYITHGKRHKE